MKEYKKAGVVGSGVMGAQIAALLAGAGLDVELLDIVPPEGTTSSDSAFRNHFALDGVARLSKSKFPVFFTSKDSLRIKAGNLEDNLDRLGSCDLVIEAIVEKLDVKLSLYKKLYDILKNDAVLASNTSGILRKMLVEGMPPKLEKRFLITHFFNPPRYMKLLEVVSSPSVEPDILKSFIIFAEKNLGKGVVITKDTPGFIANRLGVFYVLDVMHRVDKEGWLVEAVDAVLGKATARPKTGVFRTIDMAGIDTLSYVSTELLKNCPDDEWISRLRIPQFMGQMVMKGYLGDKSGQGFYRKDKESGQIMVFDPAKFDYRTKINFSTPSLEGAARIPDPVERIRYTTFSKDQAGEIAWPVIASVLVYAANRIPEISDDIVSVDSAMRWGYHWELGPFETWDALGIYEVIKRLEKSGVEVPTLVLGLLKSGHESFYEWHNDKRYYFDFATEKPSPIVHSDKQISIEVIKKSKGVVEENSGASLIDAGDGIFICEFRTKMNAIDGDIIQMVGASIDRVEKDGIGLLIANDGEQFSVGANLLLILMASQQKRWHEIDSLVKEFQSMSERIRFASKPVVAVPFGMALGGGCEICLAASRRVVSIETYIGLVEMGAGVIPAGGGCKNLILRMEEYTKPRGGPQPKVNAAFEMIATARVSQSALDAMQMGMLISSDVIVMDRERLFYEAKCSLKELSKDYVPPVKRDDIELSGRGGEMALHNAIRGFIAQGKASEYDALIARRLAHVLTGGDVPTIHTTSEKHILDLEREAFLSLVGETKTQERMMNLLQTGKPLRN